MCVVCSVLPEGVPETRCLKARVCVTPKTSETGATGGGGALRPAVCCPDALGWGTEGPPACTSSAAPAAYLMTGPFTLFGPGAPP